jgi:hypothetical protein
MKRDIKDFVSQKRSSKYYTVTYQDFKMPKMLIYS